MDSKKIILITLIAITITICATALTFSINPKMHKTIQLESILFKRSK